MAVFFCGMQGGHNGSWNVIPDYNWVVHNPLYTWYIYIYTWNSNDPCFDWKRPSFEGFNHQNRGQTGSRYTQQLTRLLVICHFKVDFLMPPRSPKPSWKKPFPSLVSRWWPFNFCQRFFQVQKLFMENLRKIMEMLIPICVFKLGHFFLDEGPSHSETPVFFLINQKNKSPSVVVSRKSADFPWCNPSLKLTLRPWK